MIRMHKMLVICTALLAFLLTETFCLADSRESTPDGNYVAYESGTVRDNDTGLEWMEGPDNNTTWEEAKTWVESLPVGEG